MRISRDLFIRILLYCSKKKVTHILHLTKILKESNQMLQLKNRSIRIILETFRKLTVKHGSLGV